MIFRVFIFLSLILTYSIGFSIFDQKFQNKTYTLKPALPAKFQKIAAGYLSQVTSEIIFIKTSVFLGGVKPGTPEKSYANTLANNFEVITSLYPEFMDPYFFCQSFLPSISHESAERANSILNTGIKAYPDNLIIRFFYAFNFYRYLNEPLKAAEAFGKAAKIPDAPPMFAHLAAVFSGKGGDITTGLVMLQNILAVEQNEAVQERYQKEIEAFENALLIENAISLYTKKYKIAPEKLELLIPEFIEKLPQINNTFKLVYDCPNLSLVRP